MKTRDDRFWDKVEKTDTCWLWKGNKNNCGYGYFWNGEKRVLAHRYSFEMMFGVIKNCVLHSCDVRLCVRPDHIFDGTRQDNMKDMISKGRAKHPSMRGKWTKLNPEHYKEIKTLWPEMTLHEIGSKFGISYAHVWGVLHGKVGEYAI